MAPRMPPAAAAAWARVGLRPLDILEHFATESTMPSGWRVYSASFCHSQQHTDPDVDCTLERTPGVFVHAYSTVVAGYDHADFGIDTLEPAVVASPSMAGTGNVPLLYEIANISGLPRVLVAATKISDLVKHRFAPRDHWRSLWHYILQEFAGTGLRLPLWTPAVGPTYLRNATLQPTWRRDALVRATDWLLTRRGPVACDPMPCSPVWDGVHPASSTSAGMSMLYQGEIMCGTQEWLPRDVREGAMCLIEGTNGVVFPNGSQQMLAGDRSDCNAEGAMAAAFRAVLEAQPGGDRNKSVHFANISKKLLDYIFVLSGSHINSSYVSWGHMKEQASVGAADPFKPGPRVPQPIASDFYSDDNARDNMGGIAAVNLLHGAHLLANTSVYDAKLVTLGLALLRTTGTDGFRPQNINGRALESGGWEQFFNNPHRSKGDNPHFIAQLWANFFWLHNVTGIELFKTQALKGLALYMSDWPAIFATESLTEELSRLLLPLAWRVRVEDSPRHRDELRNCWLALKKRWNQSVGVPTCEMSQWGQMCPPCANNACYGNGERSVCQASGDPASDVLYESNFLMNNLIEAFEATGESEYNDAAEQLAQYIARIQATSKIFPHYEGTWFRGFDYDRWEVFGSSADWGWPAYGIETGWTMTWITAGLGLRELNKGSLWALVTARSLEEVATEYCPRFFEVNASTACA